MPLRRSTRQFFFQTAVLLLGLAAASPSAKAQGAIGDTTTTPIAGVPHDYITGLNEIVNPANGALSIRIRQPVPHERGQNWPAYAFVYPPHFLAKCSSPRVELRLHRIQLPTY